MEIPIAQLPPGDPRLVEAIVGQLKSKGIFDKFRKECLADVDTKPAFLNLRQRVDGQVKKFLDTKTWKNDLNKNQLRDGVRKNIQESGILDSGIDAIINQVVNPKIKPLILPYVEETVYTFLEIERPKREIQQEYESQGHPPLPPPPHALLKAFYSPAEPLPPPSYPHYPAMYQGPLQPPFCVPQDPQGGEPPRLASPPPPLPDAPLSLDNEDSSMSSQSEISVGMGRSPVHEQQQQQPRLLPLTKAPAAGLPPPAAVADILPMETDVISSGEDDILVRNSPTDSPSSFGQKLDTMVLQKVKMEEDNAVDSFDTARGETDNISSAVEKMTIKDEKPKSADTVSQDKEEESVACGPLFDNRSLDSISSNTSGLSFCPSSATKMSQGNTSENKIKPSENSNKSMDEVRSTASTPLVDEKSPRHDSISSENSKSWIPYTLPKDLPSAERITIASFSPFGSASAAPAPAAESARVVEGASPVSADEGSMDSSIGKEVDSSNDVKASAKCEKSEGEVSTSSNSSSSSAQSLKGSANPPSSSLDKDKQSKSEGHSSSRGGSSHYEGGREKHRSRGDEKEKERERRRSKDDRERRRKSKHDDHSTHHDKSKHHQRDRDDDDDKDKERKGHHHSSSAGGASSRVASGEGGSGGGSSKTKKDRSSDKSSSDHHKSRSSGSHSKSHSSSSSHSHSHSKSSHSSSESSRHGRSKSSSRQSNQEDKSRRKSVEKGKAKEEGGGGGSQTEKKDRTLATKPLLSDTSQPKNKKIEVKNKSIKVLKEDNTFEMHLSNAIKDAVLPKPTISVNKFEKKAPPPKSSDAKTESVKVERRVSESKANSVQKSEDEDSREAKIIKSNKDEVNPSKLSKGNASKVELKATKANAKPTKSNTNTNASSAKGNKEEPTFKKETKNITSSKSNKDTNENDVKQELSKKEISPKNKITVNGILKSSKKSSTTNTTVKPSSESQRRPGKRRIVSQPLLFSSSSSSDSSDDEAHLPALKKVTIPLFNFKLPEPESNNNEVSPLKRKRPARTPHKSKEAENSESSSSSDADSVFDLFDSSSERDSEFEGFDNLPKVNSPKRLKMSPKKSLKNRRVATQKNFNKRQLVVVCDSDSSDMEVSIVKFCQKLDIKSPPTPVKTNDFEGFNDEGFEDSNTGADQKLKDYLSKFSFGSSLHLNDFVSCYSDDDDDYDSIGSQSTVFSSNKNTAKSVIEAIASAQQTSSSQDALIDATNAAPTQLVFDIETDSCKPLKKRKVSGLSSSASPYSSLTPAKPGKAPSEATDPKDPLEFISKDIVMSSYSLLTPEEDRTTSPKDYDAEDDLMAATPRVTNYRPLSPASDSSAEDVDLKLAIKKAVDEALDSPRAPESNPAT